ncbi:MAG: ATP-binding protein [Chlamydiae bacterium]|nr:ATP-binding protein [Chlamydiota bacterium]
MATGIEKIVGREPEIKLLDTLWASSEAEFLAVYGRRRVGKTYLIREYFSKKKCVYFEVTGQKDGSLQQQLENFIHVFSQTFTRNLPLRTPVSWKEAFDLLTQEIENLSKSRAVVLFFDELPWLATKKSGVMQALDYYWNRFWSRYPQLICVVCGSAASWMLDNLVNAKGGLHNRLTKTILLKPYNLRGVWQFLSHHGIHLTPKQILDHYMVFGGIPHYLKQIEKGKSALQNINRVCFQPDGLLYDEFDRLFQSLFAQAEDSLQIIKAIAKHQHGISREELVFSINMHSGGTLTKRLEELESAGFIQGYIPYGRRVKDRTYRVIDEYCYFYLRWIEPFKRGGVLGGKEYWQTKGKTQSALAWAGYAFENVCFKHVDQIRRALDLQAISCEIGSWKYFPSRGKKDAIGAQIDLIFDREDGVVTLCEIKYSEKIFALEKSEAMNILHKVELFSSSIQQKKQVQVALITTQGVKSTLWSEDVVQHTITLEDLLKD